MKSRFLLPLALSVLAACGGPAGLLPTAPPITGPEAARAYLNELVDVMQANSYKRKQIDWAALRASVLSAGAGATSISETQPAILRALTLLADGHSQYVPAAPGAAAVFFRARTCSASGAATAVVPPDIGYVKVTAFGGSGAASTAFADSIQAQVQSADRDGLTGWIVDLRGNGGGNMWPMLAGLGSIIGDGLVGHFTFPDSAPSRWEIRGSASRENGTTVAAASSSYTLRQPAPRVAVLVDNGVASSGEAAFITFRGRPNTRSFGVPTCGLSSAVKVYAMSDSASLYLADGLMADRNMVSFGDQISPDEILTDVVSDAVVRATAWLRSGS